MKRGLDISYCQKGLDLKTVKDAGMDYVIIRAGCAESVDSQLGRHTKGAADAGLPYGFYWYSMAYTVEQAEKEADACLSAISRYAPAYPVYYDMEEQKQIDKLDSATRTAIITTFCDIIREYGYTAGVYINPSWLETYVDKTKIVGKYDLWLACWTGDPNKPSSKFNYGQKMWQWGLDKVGGMKVDGDVCYFDYDKQPKKAPIAADSNAIYRSLGTAAKRRRADKNGFSGENCANGGYYAASQLVTPPSGTQQWFRHAGTNLYSALTDESGTGAKQFEQYGTYTMGLTVTAVNVRVSPGVNMEKLGTLDVGKTVYLTGKTEQEGDRTWAQVVYNGRLAWMDKQWIKT